jgi:DNA replication and repair protein RecF
MSPVRSALIQLRLTDFRCYHRADLAPEGRSVFLFGPNGAGKTNLLEAISLLSPGRGLRGAALSEVGRREPAEADGAPWAISARIADGEADMVVGTGVETRDSPRRLVRIDGEPATPGELARRLRPMWLTPAQDRLFLDGAADRRRFLDRLVFAAEPLHAAHVGAYERALRERTRLLAEEAVDPAWVKAVESRLAAAGALVAEARARVVQALAEEIGRRARHPFPRAGLALTGPSEREAADGASAGEIESRLAAAFEASRSRDRAAGRALVGPHRGDLAVTHLENGRSAAECSTGEQKALILNLVLAQAARLSRVDSEPSPILLLDEVAAHLDPGRRAALFDEIEALSLQAFLTGTEEALFETLKGRAMGVHVDASRLTILDA